MGEPLIRAGNITSALVATGAHVAGYPRIALMLVVLDVLDVVGRQVSSQYAEFVRTQSGPARAVAGLGLAGNLLGVDPDHRPDRHGRTGEGAKAAGVSLENRRGAIRRD